MKNNHQHIAETGPKYGQIMEINVSGTSTGEVLTRVQNFISHNKTIHHNGRNFIITTPNPELVLMAQSNSVLKEALNFADLSIPDGVGLNFAYKFLYGKSLNIIPGRKIFPELIKLADREKWKVFLFGGLGEEADLAAQVLASKYCNVKILSEKGPRVDDHAEPVSEIDKKIEKDVIDKVNSQFPDLLFVAFGNPRQEIWVYKNAKKLNAKCIMTVGGAFRYVAGLSSLPPEWMEKGGLEWLWRLITEPKRIRRIVNAVVVFPLRVILSKYK
jgi:N-acetylglucosaminyldiphosphoundecaprenol N-acetyl-beta-D-mannosaminyltransferase